MFSSLDILGRFVSTACSMLNVPADFPKALSHDFGGGHNKDAQMILQSWRQMATMVASPKAFSVSLVPPLSPFIKLKLRD